MHRMTLQLLAVLGLVTGPASAQQSIIVGDDDNLVYEGAGDDTSQRPLFWKYALQWSGGRMFDQRNLNTPFAHTIELPPGLTSLILRVDVQADAAGQTTDDGLLLQYQNANNGDPINSMAWLGRFAFIAEGDWVPNYAELVSVNVANLFKEDGTTLDLLNEPIHGPRATRYLDVLIGGNTGVDYIQVDYTADCNGNGIEDAEDIAAGTLADLNGNGVPDCCEDCNNNDIPDDMDIADGTSQDIDGDGIPDECTTPCTAYEHATITGDTPVNWSRFGEAVAVEGNTLVAGGPEEIDGRVVVFEHDGNTGWLEQQVLEPSDPNGEGMRFGWDLDFEGEWLVIGSYGDHDGLAWSGAAYIFHLEPDGTWVETQKIQSQALTAWERYGYAVDIDGDRIAIGMESANSAGPGAVETYVRSGMTWTFEQRIESPETNSIAEFGYSLALAGDVLVVGEPTFDDVYVYWDTGGSWALEDTLVAPPTSPGNTDLGSAVAFADGWILGGAPNDDQEGAVYTYRHDGGGSWTYTQTLRAGNTSGPAPDFGNALDMDGTWAIVGDFGNYSQKGRAYVYERWDDFWAPRVVLRGTLNDTDHVGHDVAIDGARAVVGAPRLGTKDPGGVLLFGGIADCTGDGGLEICDPDDWVDCNGNGTLDICDIAYGDSADVNGNSIPDECECLGDFNDDGVVDVSDILALLGAWGSPDADITGDGTTDVSDMLALLAVWGPCS